MKKISVLSAFFCLLLATGMVFAQNKAANFAGSWELDVPKSKLPERMRVESMTMNVTQTGKELKVETTTKRAPRPEGDRPAGNANGGGMQRGGMGRGGMMGGNGTVTYSLDGKETTVAPDAAAGMPAPPAVTLKAETETGGKLKLTSTRSFDTQNGSMTIKTTEVWELTDGGKGLKVTRETESPRGNQTSEMYFVRKISSAVSVSGRAVVSMVTNPESGSELKNPSDTSLSGMSQTPKQISAGVLNGKALQLVKPSYPAEARDSKASGAVNVQVVIDEQGNVISAKAVSGDTALRAASEEAARNSKFAPTSLSGIPVKVTGVIVYNFVP